MVDATIAPSDDPPSQNKAKRTSEDMAKTAPSAKRTRSTYTNVIKVVVGPQSPDDAHETFYVHEDMIKDRSTFFEAALSKDWVENQEKIVTLPTEQPELFRLYLECLYNPGAVDFAKLMGIDVVDNKVANKEQYMNAVEKLYTLWIMADFLGDMGLTNQVMDGIIIISQLPGGSLRWSGIINNYNNTSTESGLRRWSVDWWSAVMSPAKLLTEEAATIPQGLLVSVLKKVLEDRADGRKGVSPTIKQSSTYHARIDAEK